MDNIWVTWGDVFNSSLQGLWIGFIEFAPKLIIAMLLFIVGWVLGNLVAKAFEQVIGSMKLDNLLESVGADDVLRRAGIKLNSGYFIGQLLKWFVLIIFLMPSLALVGLDYVALFLKEDVLAFVPQIIVAAFVLIIASVVADATNRAVVAGTKAMGVTTANLVGTISKYAIWVFAFIIALGQLGVAPAFMQILFTGIIGMFAIAGAIAFGIGGKDAASRLIEKIEREAGGKK